MPTAVSVSEYGAAVAVVGMVNGSVPVNPLGIWDSCMDALQAMTIAGSMGYKSSQTKKSVARPGHWSGPATNLGAAAQNTKWKSACLMQPHVHLGGLDERAVIGCVLTPAVGGTTYLTMNIYISANQAETSVPQRQANLGQRKRPPPQTGAVNVECAMTVAAAGRERWN